MEKNLSAIYKETQQKLSTIHGDREAQLIADMLFQDLLGISKTDRILNPNRIIDSEALESAMDRLMQHEPIQHILGESHFYGHIFKVNQHTLIPRPETEELVDLVLKENKENDLKILDIGTGTGCIAISLALALPYAEVTAWDISEEALAIARENALKLGAKVKFEKVDVLHAEFDEQFDIIVSNPPYIPEAERTGMDPHVKEYEPGLALFVPDNTPLLFYDRIAQLGKTGLKDEGSIYLELHENFAFETRQLYTDKGYNDSEIIMDNQNKPRILKAIKRKV